jgi:hypothetical protein
MKLHADRACAPANAQRRCIFPHRARDGSPINAMVLIEAGVFNRNDGINQVGAELVEIATQTPLPIRRRKGSKKDPVTVFNPLSGWSSRRKL